MTYEEALQYIEDVRNIGSILGLDSIRELLKRFQNPQDQLKIIHVAGTNGKGSTCAFLASILSEGGYSVGRYNSPSVFYRHETISIRDKSETGKIITEYISEDEFTELVYRIKEVCDAMVSEGFSQPTAFEIETAMAFLYFQKMKCDLVILEVGMGGRLDATNVIEHQLCSVLASISMDHIRELGDTIEKIAYEKAGIIKEHDLVITTQQEQEVLKVIEDICKEKSAALIVSNSQKVKIDEVSLEGTKFHGLDDFNELSISLLGTHQIQNAVLAIDVILALREKGIRIQDRDIRLGLKNTVWHGRFEVIYKEPIFMIDGAHNIGAAKVLTKAIRDYFPEKKLVFLCGMFADKDYQGVLHEVLPYGKEFVAIQSESKRALFSNELADTARCELVRLGLEDQCHVYDAHNVREGIKIAYDLAEEDDVVLAFGSLSFLKTVYEFFPNYKFVK